jgi:type I restriction enzyme M protein
MNRAPLTYGDLESHLWEAANILRGPVDAADFKTYVFPLLFFKRISGVHDEEYQIALEESGGDEEYARFPQNYRFQIPEACHWRDVRAITTNVGQALQKAMRDIERANPVLRHRTRGLYPRLPPAQDHGPQEEGAHPRCLPRIQVGPGAQ